MQKAVNVKTIINEIEYLGYSDQMELLEKLVGMVKRKSTISKRTHTIKDLKGLGKDLWKNIAVEEYINRERDSWE